MPSLNAYLRWPGGKRRLVPKIKALYDQHRHLPLYEPFCGALNVALGLQPEYAILNDANQPLINLHRHVQLGLRIEPCPPPTKESYYIIRERFNEYIQNGLGNQPIAAQHFYYLNRLCFNGLCRYSKSSGFNVPFGDIKKPVIKPDLFEYKPAMRNWCFLHGDFEKPFPGVFIYADPPYDDGFTNYSGNEFSWSDQERLAKYLASHDGPVIASNKRTQRIEELYRDLGFEIEIIEMPRSISCKGDRAPVEEIFATKGI